MPVYEFRGFDVAGKAIKGVRDAESAKGLRALLKREGVLATEVKESGKEASGAKSGGVLSREVNIAFLQRVSADDLGIATRQLATLLQAGVPMVDSLSAFFFQAEDGIRDLTVTGVQTCALPICTASWSRRTHSCSSRRVTKTTSSISTRCSGTRS